MKTIHKINLNPFLLLLFFVASLLASHIIITSPRVSAINDITTTVIDRTRIRVDSVTISQTDYNNANSNIKDRFTKAELQQKLTSNFAGEDFGDSNIWDDNENYTFSADGCTSEINNFDTPDDNADVIFRIDTADGCKSITSRNVPLGDYQELRKAFAWDDEATIIAYQQDWVFTQTENNPQKFSRGDSNCPDYVLLSNSGGAPGGGADVNAGSGVWHEQNSDQAGSNCRELDGWGEGRPNGTPVRIGQLENRALPAGTGDNNGRDGDGDGDGEEEESCESRNNDGLDWLLCGVVNFIDKMLIGSNGTGGLLGEVDDLLNISDQYYDDEGLVTAWSYFKNVASLALVLVALVMVIGQAISKE